MKGYITKSKGRRAVAAATAVLLTVFSFLAVQGEGLQMRNLVLALFLSVMAGALILLDVHMGKVLSAFWYLLLPLLALCCMEFYTHVPWDLTGPILLLNYLFYLIWYLICTCLTGSSRWGGTVAPLLPMLFGLANYFVVEFRSSPIVPWDFYSIGTAATVTDNYTFSVSWRLLFVVIGFVYIMIQGEKTGLKIKPLPVRAGGLALSMALMASYVTAVKTDEVGELAGLDTTLFTPNVLYRNNGFAAAFLANFQYMDVEKPEGYSQEKTQEIAGASVAEHANDRYALTEEQPNIIVIMNEAFSDLRVYGDFATSEEVMPFIDSLSENTIKGSAYVSVRGGNTANSEFEFLTGNTMAFMPAGSVPYQQYLKSEMPSLASWLGSLGYQTAALHPYGASGWNRDEVYPLLGFDSTYFRSDFEDASTLRGYVDDRSAFEKLIELYENKGEGEKLFAFEVTMQNHGGYSKEYEDLSAEILISAYDASAQTTSVQATEKYLTLIRKTDEAFQELVEYFAAQEEKTIILMFGDHQPSDYICNAIWRLFGEDKSILQSSAENLASGYQVPFILWANYDLPQEEIEAVSLNYLGGYLLETAQIPLTDYQKYLDGLSEEYPVVTAGFYGDYADGSLTFHEWSEEPENSSLDEYRILQYNNLVDFKNRISGFFGVTGDS